MAKKEPLYPHVPKSRKPREPEELKNWVDLTPEEELAYATRVVKSGILGWENMKEVAYEMGIEPDEDAIPTLYELQVMVKKHEAGQEQREYVGNDYEVDVYYTGYITVEVHAASEKAALEIGIKRAERQRSEREGKFIEEFMPNLQNWPERTQVSEVS